jgi:hypothetical protein
MKTRFRILLAGLMVGTVVTMSSVAAVAAVSPDPSAGPGGAGGPAGRGPCATQALAARTSQSVETLRAFGDCEIARRFTTLDNLATRVSDSKRLTSAHAATLSGMIASTRTGLTALKATIDSETSVEALKAEIKQIATDYRVYVLLAPQVRLVSGADGVVAADAIFDEISTKLTQQIADAKAAGKDTTVAQAKLDAMNAAVAQAVALADPIPGKLLVLTPADWNSGAAGPVLAAAREDMFHARELLREARQDARECRDALK